MDFRVVLLEGVFYKKDPSDFGVRQSAVGPETIVSHELSPLVGTRVRVAMHHLPPNLHHLDESQWGGGSCLWQPLPCPANHHVRPGYLLNVTGDGVLRYDDQTSEWWLDQLNGTRLDLPLPQMEGHFGRIAAATLFDVEKIRDSLSLEDLGQIEELGSRLTSVRELLDRMRQDS